MDKKNLAYGISKTNTGYETEPIIEGKQYDMYIATSFRTTAGCKYQIVNENLEDLIEAKGWSYRTLYYWGCICFTGYKINVTLKKRAEEIEFTILECDNLHSEYIRIMMLIADTCATMDEAKRLLNKNHYEFDDMEERRNYENKMRGEKTSSSTQFFIEPDKDSPSNDNLPF